MGRRRGGRRKLPETPVEAEVESLSHDGRGVAHIDGKVTFIHGALPGERLLFQYTAKRKDHDEGNAVEILQPSPDRVVPVCKAFGVCGGCSLQHMNADAQIQAKQKNLLDSLQRIGKVIPEAILPPLQNESPWGYRRKARLGVKHVLKKDKVLEGFRERGTSFITVLEKCHVLHPKVGEALLDLSALIEGLTLHDQIPQIEVAMDDERCVLIFRVLDQPSADDLQQLQNFGNQQGFYIYLQPAGPDSIYPLGEAARLHYQLPDYSLELDFLPTDFTQVNSDINRQMINNAVNYLQLDKNDNVLDLFCGIGNFALPLARSGARVTGVEGDAALIERARHNAELNGLAEVRFFTADLYGTLDNEPWMGEKYNKVLLDPPRSGALDIVRLLARLGAEIIVYVSCYPGTLARDADVLVNELGYTIVSAGVMDMFPHTAHVESLAVFQRLDS